VLYDTAARVQEICDLKIGKIRWEKPFSISLTGKVNKSCIVPLLDNTMNLLKIYINEHFPKGTASIDKFLFFNCYKGKLNRFGVSYTLDKYSKILVKKYTNISFSISPHTLRHSKVMHMYQSNINLFYIRDILGHVDIATTDLYAKSNVELKRLELEKMYNVHSDLQIEDWNDNAEILKFLKSF
jgi:site-specific recombinase XerD